MEVPSPADARGVLFARVLQADWIDGGTTTYRTAWATRMLAVSSDGVEMRLAQEFAIGTVLTIEICDEDQGSWGHFLLRVVAAWELQNGTWVISARFTQSLPEEQCEAELE
jgi:hypothetical protein